MSAKLAEINPVTSYLNHIVHPEPRVEAIYSQALAQALDLSGSSSGVVLICGPAEPVAGALPDFKRLESPNSIKQAWRASRSWTDSTRTAADNWLREMAGARQVPYML